MYELNDFAQHEEPEFEPRSRTVSFPDHYLLPYIEWCKKSKYITCGCSIMFFGLAIFCFFATNYILNYPATVSRKIAFVFAAVFCIVCGVTCLELRFRILKQCRYGSDDNIQFEIARRDIGASATSSFSGRFEIQETPFAHGTPKEGQSQTKIPEDSSNLGYSTDNEASVIDGSIYKFTGPRHSISDGLSPYSPLLPLKRPLEISKSFLMRNSINTKQLKNGGTTSSIDNYLPNYSTFENENDSPEIEPLLPE